MLTWEQIDSIGADMGAKETTRAKWRQRGVPWRWKLDMLERLRKAGAPASADIFPPPVKKKTPPDAPRDPAPSPLETA